MLAFLMAGSDEYDDITKIYAINEDARPFLSFFTLS